MCIIEFEIVFFKVGIYVFYVCVCVGLNIVEDDSFFIFIEFGRNNGWEMINSILGFVVFGELGYEVDSLVIVGGLVVSNVWKWIWIVGLIYMVFENSLD